MLRFGSAKQLENTVDDTVSQTSRSRQTALRVLQIVLLIVSFAAILLFVYREVVFRDMKLSFTSVTYSFPPFSSLGVDIAGPLLSDPADNVLPIAWVTYHISGFTTWLTDFALGTAQTMSLYLSPLNWFYALDFDVAQQIISVLKFTVPFIGMFLFLRRLACSWRGAFIAGISFAFSSAMVMWHGWPHSEVSMYAPYLFWLIDLMLTRICVRYCVGVALVVYLMMVPGMPTYAAYFFYLGFAYGLFYVLRIHWGEVRYVISYLAACAIPAVIGVLMSLPYSGQLLLSVGGNGYSASRAGQALATLPLCQVKTLLLPYVPTSAGIHLNESVLFTGVLAILSVCLTIVHFKKKRRAGFFFIASCVLTLLIFTNVLSPVFTHLPLINTSLKFRVIILLNFSLSVLAGINLDDLLTRTFDGQFERIMTPVLSAIPLVAFIALIIRVYPVIIQAGERYMMLETFVGLALGIALFLVSLIRALAPKATIVAMVCSVALVVGSAVDSGYFASKYLPLIESEATSIPPATSSISYLQDNLNDAKFASLGSWTVMPSVNMYYGIRDVRGHGLSFSSQDLTNYYAAVGGDGSVGTPTRPVWESIDNFNLLRYLGVKYLVMTEAEFSEYNADFQDEIVGYDVQDDGLVICELSHVSQIELVDEIVISRDDAGVLAMMMEEEFDPNTLYLSEETTQNAREIASVASATKLSDDEVISNISTGANGSITFSVTTNEDRYVLVNEYNDGNWKAYIDGEESPVLKGNYLFRAIEVPAGTHTVELKYEPTALYVFFIIAGVASVSLVVIAIAHRPINRLLSGGTGQTDDADAGLLEVQYRHFRKH